MGMGSQKNNKNEYKNILLNYKINDYNVKRKSDVNINIKKNIFINNVKNIFSENNKK